ncbi:MAG: V-type ATP synthase subunit C [Methanomicrobiaceae archaeon]|nr:V-type ATP synthase subunit C [Methanomicrobiaceae archaeon]
MVEVKTGPGAYIYACTRLRIRKTTLLPREDYLRLLNMGLPEITRFIEESAYKKEIDELGTSFSGIDLVEVALSWNLAKEYQKILDIMPGTLKEFAANYLRRWDIQNVLTILRGKQQGMKPGKIKELLVPAGSLDRIFLDRLLSEDSPARVVEALKGTRLYPVASEEINAAMETGSFSHMADEMYKEFYQDLVLKAESGLKGGVPFREYIRMEIDMKNIQILCRLRQERPVGDITGMLVEGGSFSLADLQRLAGLESDDEFIDALEQKRFARDGLQELLDDLRQKRPIHEIEVHISRIMMERMEHLTKRYPFSVCPVLEYLERKWTEVRNLRALARGKKAELPADRIRGYLVM